MNLVATSYQRKEQFDGKAADIIVLPHDERHLRRKLLHTQNDMEVLANLVKPVALNNGDALILEDGRTIKIVAASEELYEIKATSPIHLSRLCWHIGNRHLPAEINEDHILISRDHVIKKMLIGLGATVSEVTAPFSPERGAYHDTSHHHDK